MDPSAAYSRQPKQHRRAHGAHNVTPTSQHIERNRVEVCQCVIHVALHASTSPCKNNYFILLKLTHSNINLHAKYRKCDGVVKWLARFDFGDVVARNSSGYACSGQSE